MPWQTHHGMLTSVAALAIAAGGGGPSPTKTFDFTLGSLPSGVTFSRTTQGTYFNSSGVLTLGAIDAPRLDYNPSTLAARGLLVEPAATNLVLGSGDLANATYWSLASATATANSTTSPDGTTNMALITESSGSGLHFVYTTAPPTVSSGTNYASSVFIKAGTRRYVQVGFGLVSDPRCAGVVVDTTNMTISGTGAGASGTYVDSGIESLGGGLARVWVVGSIGATTGYLSVTGTDSSSFSATPSSSGSQTFYAYGGQVELGTAPTSYIPTTTASVTRAADAVSTSDATALAAKGFVIATGELLQSVTATLLGINSIVGLGKTLGNALTTTDGGTQTTGNTATWTGTNKSGLAFDSTPRVSIVLNGGTVVTAANTPVTPTALHFGSAGGSSSFIRGHVRKLDCYATLTDVELQSATT